MTPAVRKAFVLGAGLGTRLRPLTDDLPKPLVPIFGKPLITFALDHLRTLGVESFVINTHHLAPAFEAGFGTGEYRGSEVKLIHEPVLLETGGGIKNAQALLEGGPFIVYSGDVLTDIDIEELVERHARDGNDVTLALRETGLASSIALEEGKIVDIRGKFGVSGGYDFANVSIWNPSIFTRIAEGLKVSFIPVLIDWMAAGARVGGVVLNEKGWFNIGSRGEYLKVHQTIFEGQWRPSYLPADVAWPVLIDPSAEVDPTARIEGYHALGAGVSVGAGAIVKNSVLWPGAKIAPGAQLESCIVRTGRHVEETCCDADL